MSLGVGTCLGNYYITAKLGQGTDGKVYQGRHLFLPGRVVAIKVLHNSSLNSQEERERFRRETFVLNVLKHPSILPLLDAGVFEGIPYLVTEYAPGGSLKDRLGKQHDHPLTPEDICSILWRVGTALAYAHQHQIVHRDLKPSNILFNGQGEALLADFGNVSILSTARTERGDVRGTPLYMAPEQFYGYMSPKSDQYALACIAYELMTEKKPFSAPDFLSLGFKHLTVPPLPPTYYNPHINAQVEKAILKAMAKQRTDRYDDIGSFLNALQCPFLSAASAPRKPGGSATSLTSFMKEKPTSLHERDIIRWMIQLCEAVNAHHTQKPPCILGEIRPDQVVITSQGNAHLLNKSKEFASDPHLFKPFKGKQRYLGEYSYASPEFLRYRYHVGEKGSVDVRTDIYALGAIMYHMLTNTIPEPLCTPSTGVVPTHNQSLCTVLVDGRMTYPSEQVVLKALQQDPDRRFRYVQAMRTALDYCLFTVEWKERETKAKFPTPF
jgi:serine/threonine protein kinase